jgi:hypothetical protein
MSNRLINWILVNGFFLLALVSGVFYNVEAAETLAIFMAWITVIFSFFLKSEHAQEEMVKQGRSVPKYVDMVFDIIIVGILIYGGWWITSLMYLIHISLFQQAWDMALKPKE